MSVILLLTAVSRCASPELCPSDRDLIAAITAYDAANAGEVSNAAAAAGELVLIHPQRIRSIDDVICSDRVSGELPTLMCSMTIRYWSMNAYQVAKLVRKGNEWRVAKALTVTRYRR